jgi:restriction system protein
MIPKFYELLAPLLEAIAKQNLKRKIATAILSEKLALSEEQRAKKLDSGNYIFENRVGWAFTFLIKAEYIELREERATYKITDLGCEALKDVTKNNKILDIDYLIRNSPNYEKNWKIAKSDNKNNKLSKTISSTEEISQNTIFDLEEELQKNQEEFDIQLLEKIKDMSWQNFEDFCANLIEKMGYGVAAKRKIRSRDGGIDGEILEDELGLRGKIYLQAKQWQSNSKVGSKDMREFLYNIRGKKGVFITTSDFSEDARSEAGSFKDGSVALINYQELIRLCKKYQHLCEKKNLEIFQLI